MGIKTLAITDHFDPGFNSPVGCFQLDFSKYERALLDAKEKYRDRLEIILGIEGGIMEGQLTVLDESISKFPYDFAIGSFHSYKTKDITVYDFKKENHSEFLRGYYEFIYNCLKNYSNYDVVGHFTYIDRYIGKLYDYNPYEDIIDETLKNIIAKGKGLEINTSSFAYTMKTWLPRESVLRRYKELGGEILTFGSDAHSPKNYMSHFNEAAEFAKSLGFRYYCIFRSRRPDYYAL